MSAGPTAARTAAILINIPGTAASAATALDGYPLACKGEGGRAIGLTTTASAIGTIISMLFLVSISPLISFFALQFTSFEFFLLAFFGILISGTLTSPDLVIKGWIAGFLGLFLACVGRDLLQFYPRFTFGIPELDSGVEVVPVLIGAFGIPQIIQVLKDRFQIGETQKFQRIMPEFGTIVRNIPRIIRSALIGVGIGSVPGIGEDIAAWVSYGTAKNTSKHPERFGKGEITAVLSTEVANNACVGGAMIPLLNLGIPGSPPAAMLLGALMLHGVTPGPMITFEHPTFIMEVAAILLLASVAHVGDRDAAGQAGGQGAANSDPDFHADYRGSVHYRLLFPGTEYLQPLSDAAGGDYQLLSDRNGISHRPARHRRDPGPHGRRKPATGVDGFPGKFSGRFLPGRYRWFCF